MTTLPSEAIEEKIHDILTDLLITACEEGVEGHICTPSDEVYGPAYKAIEALISQVRTQESEAIDMTDIEEAILEEFRKKFTEKEAFGGDGGYGVRIVWKYEENPDYRDEIMIDKIEDFIRSLISQVRSQEREAAVKVAGKYMSSYTLGLFRATLRTEIEKEMK